MKNTFHRVLALLLSIALIGGMILPVAAAELLTAYDMDGAKTNNASEHDYIRWSKPVNSYLGETDGKLVRVEYAGGDELTVEWYSPEGGLLSTGSVEKELPLFGGFYFGQTWNFAVFGQSNPEEKTDLEVLRVVKYDKSMNRLAAVSYYGENTYIPFDAGSLRMAETAGRLYIHTCHEMFQSSDGYHHQANMYFCINESTMQTLDRWTGVMNISYYGYVSHSFNQFIATDGDYVFRADHGDAHMRGVSITRFNVSADNASNTAYTVPLAFAGPTGANSTGAALGGMALSANRVLLAGRIDSQTGEYDSFSDIYSKEQYNIFVISAAKSLAESENKVVYITGHAQDAGIKMGAPHLTAIGGDRFLLLWEETENSATAVKAAVIDENGALQTKIRTLQARLSDCAPLLTSDGMVCWYAGDGSSETLYRLDPAQLSVEEPVILEMTVSAGAVSGKPGDTVSVPVNVTGNPGFAYLKLNFGYDADALELVNAENGEVSTDSFSRGTNSLSWDTGEDAVADGLLCTLTFRIKDGAEGEYEIALNPVACYNINEDTVTVYAENGTVTAGHVHSWNGGEITKTPTCAEAGEKTYTCTKCSETKTEPVEKDPANHADYGAEVINAEAARCYRDGYTGDTVCLGCGAVLQKGEVISKDTVPHAWDKGTVVQKPTCSATGLMRFACTVKSCGAVDEKEIPVDPKAHDFKITVYEPTCTDPGYTSYACTLCRYGYSADETDPLGHDWGAWAALNGNEHSRVCGRDASHTETEPHSWDDGKVTAPATCAEAGEKTYTCTVCGETRTDVVAIDPANHTGETEVKNAKRATCGDDGYTGDTYCKACGAMLAEGEIIPAAGEHSWSEWNVTKEPTATEPGERSRMCAVCLRIETEEIPPVIPADTTLIAAAAVTGKPGDTVAVPVTVTNNPGFSYLKLSFAYNAEALEFVKAENGTVSTDSFTVTDKALQWDTGADAAADGLLCTLFFKIKDGAEGAYAVTLKAAQCWNIEEAEIEVLLRDGSVTAEPETHIHSWNDGEVTKPATCVEAGEITFTCTVCGETRTGTVAVDPANHTGETEVKNAKPATCGEAGYTGDIFCKACGVKLAEGEAIPATGEHSWSEWTVTIEPAPGVPGERSRMCAVCLQIETEEIPPLFLLGDVDLDGRITAADARLALRRAVNLEDYATGSVEFRAADVDFDNNITASDARSILRAAVNLEDPADWVK